MNTRPRYDTTALIEKMHLERKRTLMVGMGIGGALTIFVIIYIFNMRGLSVADVAGDPASPKATGEAAAQQVAGATAGPTPSAPGTAESGAPSTAAEVKAPVEKKPAGIKASFPNGALVWLDDAPLQRTSNAHEVTPGMHTVRMKIGKLSLSHRVLVAAGELAELRLDKQKKLVVDHRPLTAKTRLE